jgi:hypothetical protein
MFHIQVTAVVKKANEAVLEKCVQERQNTINDRVTTIIRSADPKFMNEPGLETIRRQI